VKSAQEIHEGLARRWSNLAWVVHPEGFRGSDKVLTVTVTFNPIISKWAARVKVGGIEVAGLDHSPEVAIMRAYQNMRGAYAPVLDTLGKLEEGIFGRWKKEDSGD